MAVGVHDRPTEWRRGTLPRPALPMWRGPLPPMVLTALNGVLFLLLSPNVNDLWAARARASAARHGVGLTYWFAWFSGGATPGNYSVLSPYLSALLSAELLCAIAAVGVTAATYLAVRSTNHPVAATWVAAAGAVLNLWSGRVPFLLGTAFALVALTCVLAGRVTPAVVFAVLTVATSPVAGAFLLPALLGLWWGRPALRRVSLITAVVSVVGMGLIAVLFGAPGPQPFSTELLVMILLSMPLFLLAGQPPAMRYVLYLMPLLAIALFVVPNGMGSNLGRLFWFCLPPAVVALSRLPAVLAVVLVAPMVVYGGTTTVSDLQNAMRPTSGTAYYTPLVQELDRIHDLGNYRLEVVAENEHAAYDALLNHAMLARGWETQEDHAYNSALMDPNLDPVTYHIWLDNNAVGYVALPTVPHRSYPEFNLVASGQLRYLRAAWSNPDWTLFRVLNATPVVAQPATLRSHSQARLVISIPCRDCRISVRVRYSRYLSATTADGKHVATVRNDGYGWTTITPPAPGTYRLVGTLTRAFN